MQARNRVAKFLGADENELAFTYNASPQLEQRHVAALGTHCAPPPASRWTCSFSDHEYPTTNMIFQYLEQIGKARLIRFKLSSIAQENDRQPERDGDRRDASGGASHVDCNTGLRSDPKAICAWARQRGIISYIDGGAGGRPVPDQPARYRPGPLYLQWAQMALRPEWRGVALRAAQLPRRAGCADGGRRHDCLGTADQVRWTRQRASSWALHARCRSSRR